MNDKNRDKIPEKVRQDQDSQWEKLTDDEKLILASIEKIQQIKWTIFKSNRYKKYMISLIDKIYQYSISFF